MVQSNLILKGDLANSITAALGQLDHYPPGSQAETLYREGFRAALAAIATTHGVNLPHLRNAQTEARRNADGPRLLTDARF